MSRHRLIVAGSRTMLDIEWAFYCLDSWAQLHKNPAIVISGGANGADRLGEQWAAAKGIEVEHCQPDWATHGRAAGPIRNTEMAVRGTHLVAFWDGRSRGAKNMIEQAMARGLVTWVYPISALE